MTHQEHADKDNHILVILDGEIIGRFSNTQTGHRLARNERRILKNKALIVRPENDNSYQWVAAQKLNTLLRT